MKVDPDRDTQPTRPHIRRASWSALVAVCACLLLPPARAEVVVGSASAYDLFLKRNLVHAGIVRVPASEQVADAMLRQGLAVAAGVRQQLEHDAARLSGVRLLPGNFMVIRQAMVMPLACSAASISLLDRFVDECRRSGFIADALARHGIEGARVAE